MSIFLTSRSWSALILVCLLLTAASAKAVLYGEDSRQDVFELDPYSPVYAISHSIGAVVDSGEFFTRLPGEPFWLRNLTTLQDRKRVCDYVRYSEQVTMGFCSSFLISSHQVVMARHCLAATPCTRMKFVFNFSISEMGTQYNLFPESDVYNCKSYSYPRSLETPFYDFVIVELDRAVEGRAPLTLRSGSRPREDSEFYTIGHPNGLPQKVASGGNLSEHHGSYFLTRLDTFHGNSGSPVMNALTHEVEGVLIDGESDYENDRGCRVPRICTEGSCAGEKVLDISRVREFLSQVSDD